MRAAKSLILLFIVCLMAGCGFQLRNSNAAAGRTLPFATISLSMPSQSELYSTLKRNIDASASTKVVVKPSEAKAILTVLSDTSQKSILTLSAAGRAREFQLVRSFTFRVHTPEDLEYVPQSQITVRRTMTYSDDLVLSKNAEEQLLWLDMEKDLVGQLMRRLMASKSAPQPRPELE